MEEHIENAYFDALVEDGLDHDVVVWLLQMAEINQRTPSYFIMMALEELKLYLDQSLQYEIDLEEESVH